MQLRSSGQDLNQGLLRMMYLRFQSLRDIRQFGLVMGVYTRLILLFPNKVSHSLITLLNV